MIVAGGLLGQSTVWNLTLTPSATTVQVNTPFTLTADVTSFPTRTAVGVVRFFRLDGQVLTNLGSEVLANNRAQLTLTSALIGTARYGAYFEEQTEQGTPTGFGAQAPAVEIQTNSLYQYQISLIASPDAILPGDTVKFSSSVFPLGDAPQNPPGAITFFKGPVVLGSFDLAGGNQVSLNYSELTFGDNLITAEFVGNPIETYGTAAISVNVPVGLQGVLRDLPPALTFVREVGGPEAEEQTLQLRTQLGFPFTTSSDQPWLQVSPASGNTPETLRIAVNSAGLAAGRYLGRVVISAGAGGVQAVVINLIVTAQPGLIAVPERLQFSYTQGGIEPASQPLYVTSSGRMVPVTLTSEATWLELVENQGSLPRTFQIRARVANLAPGTYDATVRVASQDGSTPAINVPVQLVVSRPTRPLISLQGLVNGARQQQIPMSPNVVMTLYGQNLGGAGITRVRVEGREVPVNAVRPDQVNFTVPPFLNGYPFAKVSVEVLGQMSEEISSGVRATSPGVFTASGTGQGQAAALNEDGQRNGSTRPARPGRVVQFFVTGFGIPGPRGNDGLVRNILPVFARIGNQPATVEFAGPAPGQGEGVQQVNVRLPQQVTRGPAVPVSFNVGGVDTQPGVTIAIQ